MNQLLNDIERRTEAVQARLTASEELSAEFYARLDLSWIYHDNALEGVVLSFAELNAAIDDAIISDATLIPTYEDVQNHKTSIEFVRQTRNKKKTVFDLDYLKKLHLLLSQELSVRGAKAPAKPTPGQYRKDNPLHRMYFHEIAPPEKISYQMRKIVAWLVSDECKKMHAIKRAALAHHKLIAIYPWPKHSGKVARLLMNAMLLRDGLLPAVVHAIERQRYYEVLRQAPDALIELVAEASQRTLVSAEKFLEAVDAGLLEAQAS
jgi:Fic family protein